MDKNNSKSDADSGWESDSVEAKKDNKKVDKNDTLGGCIED